MRKLSFTIALIILIFNFIIMSVFAQENQKLAQTGMKFLSVSLDPRASGMGDATTAVFTKSSAMLYNPAMMAELEGYSDFSFGTTRWIADIDYIYGTAAFNLFDGEYGVFGLSLVAVNYGEFIGTVVAPNGDGFLEVGTFKPTSFAFGIGYANQIEENKVEALAFDFGILYHTGFKSLDFGMSVRNFATEIKYKDEAFQLPLLFKIGVSINAFDFIDVDKKMHSMLVAVDASHPRDYPEQVSFGAEYLFMETFAIRGGYTFPTDEQEFSLGVGFKQSISDIKFAIDYSYTPFGIFDNVHRISLNLAY